MMEYQEYPLLPGLEGLVAAVWTLRCGGAADACLEHKAPPDGCVELIRRVAGWSHWGEMQPEIFVAGVGLAPAALTFSGDAAFVAVRLWPWAWNMLGQPACPQFAGSWCTGPDSAAALVADDPCDTVLQLQRHFAGAFVPPAGAALIRADNVADAASAAGVSIRALQRWSMREIGLSPRRYLRLVRFGRAMHAIQHDDDALALHAADAGFADQPHMAREFRELGEDAPSAMRQKAKGPFVPRVV